MSTKSFKPVEKVLIVDDDESVRVYLRLALKTLGIREITEASNGWEGVAEYFANEPDLVLMDINMPELQGPEAIRELRKMFPDARVVMVSSEATQKRVREAIRNGVVGFIRKDTAKDELLNLLASFLEPPKPKRPARQPA
ncbi:MAG: response regulator transcription factor [Opitutales bacterium]